MATLYACRSDVLWSEFTGVLAQMVSRSTQLQVAAAVIAIATIQMLLPDQVTIGAKWLIPAIEVMGVPIALLAWRIPGVNEKRLRIGTSVLVVFLILASVLNASLLLASELRGDEDSGAILLFAGFGVLMVNVLSFGIVYWWADAGGPWARARGTVTSPDFQFPQQTDTSTWQPAVLDYLYTAYTNVIASHRQTQCR